MWKNVSLQARINVLFAFMLVLAVGAHVFQALFGAGPRIQAEEDSMTMLAQEFVEVAIASVRESADPQAALAKLVEPLRSLRHVRIHLDDTRGKAAVGQPMQDAEAEDAPRWFTRLIRPPRRSTRVPVEMAGANLGDIVIVAQPSDEISEIWDGLVGLLADDIAVLSILFLLTAIVVRHALAPIAALDKALGQLRRHAYGTRMPDFGPPELRRIFHRFNSLAEDLERTTHANQELTGKIISIQDDERREIGRELHDEFGPYLFAIRAHASVLARRATHALGEQGRELNGIGQVILDQTDALQRLNRRVLARLRPPALDELGLTAAIAALVGLWKETHPSMQVSTRVSTSLTGLDDSCSLTVYRLIQEGLTNAARHGEATHVEVSVEDGSGTPAAIRVTVTDNGSGLPEAPNAGFGSGFGLAGMGERVKALGGSISIARRSPSGVTVSALVPARQPA
jgi:two-component system, NarL family, sensor histidine kinase UhpB